jgi:hypothetical protein
MGDRLLAQKTGRKRHGKIVALDRDGGLRIPWPIDPVAAVRDNSSVFEQNGSSGSGICINRFAVSENGRICVLINGFRGARA